MITINNKNQIVICPVMPVYNNNGEVEMFTTTITLKEIGKLYNRLTYDGDAQRGYIKDKKNKRPVIDKKHVKNIKEKIEDGEPIRGHLTWNIRKFEDLEDLNLEYYEFDTVKNTLTIIGNTITLPDSAHRHKAIYDIHKEDKDNDILNSEMVLDIYNLTLQEEKQFFVSINGKGKKPNRNRVLYLSDDKKCQLIREIVNESKLKNRIETVRNNANNRNKLTKFSTLYDSLFGTAGVYKNIQLDAQTFNKLKIWLIKFYNELLNTRKEFNFKTAKEKREIKRQSMVVEELSWWAYSYMSKLLYKDTNWKRTLNNKMNSYAHVEGAGFSIDFWSKANPDWHGTLILYKFNYITQKAELGTSVYNANSTRKRIQDIVALRLFS